ncbi:hypothetical protein [Phascolarctobacterium faecium]|uniref:hypothetical protein n=1 Tax=Phascolarctobacterium faecium TaxID=33025 RepID=UPI002E769F9D|nr:hypothetical protein [Phascolarctobacterium faecium]MED9992567.1 hypothetical protein [Phascolarctobacterium faecium]
MEKMQKCTQENLQQLLQTAERQPERLKKALNIIEHSDNTEEQKIKLLKNLRFCLLDDIHFKQQLLDNVDYSIYQLRHKQCKEEKK